MKNIIKAIIAGFVIIGSWSCRGPEETVSEVKQIQLSEDQRREYNYALTEATKQKLFGNYRQAAALYRKCIEVNPKSDAAYFQLSGILMMARDLKGAREMNEKAVEINPVNYWYKIQLAQIYMIGDEMDKAVEVYENLAEQWPERADFEFELARIYVEMGRDQDALQVLERMEGNRGISEHVSMLREQIYVKQEKYDLAEKELLALLELNPEEIRLLGILAELYTTAGEKEKAVSAYEKIFEIEPENGVAQLSMAEFYRETGDPVKQFVYLEKALNNKSLDLDPKIMVIVDMLAYEEIIKEHNTEIYLLLDGLEEQYPGDFRVMTAKADFLTRSGEYEQALAIYDDVLNGQKGNYYVWEQAVLLENMLEKPQGVYRRCEEALKYFDERPLLYLFKGSAETQLGKNEDAVNTLEKGLEYVENNIPLMVQFYSYLAEAWRARNEFKKSDECFEKALEMDPENIMILNNYSYYLSLRGTRLEEAEKMSRKTIMADPENPTFLDTYAWIMFKAGKFEQAEIYLGEALKNGGDEDPDILEHYGDVLEKLGRLEDAVKYWDKAIEKGGDSESLEKKLKR